MGAASYLQLDFVDHLPAPIHRRHAEQQIVLGIQEPDARGPAHLVAGRRKEVHLWLVG